MMAEEDNVESLFAEVLQQPPDERASFLEHRCGEDLTLRRKVESLLEAHQVMGSFLEQTQSRFKDDLRPGQAEDSHSSEGSIHGRFLPGTIIENRYRIVSLAGRGGMGEVYRADDLRLGQTVALKFLPTDFANDPKRLAYFHQEVRLTRQISHPNVCRVYDIGDVNGHPFLSMEYIDGEDLRALLRRIGRLPPDKGTEIAHQLCAGLAAAHEKQVLHRDLKPANIMIDGRGHVRITDFGLAKVLGDRTEGEFAGTPAYMAPEQLLAGEVSEQSDLYSLGLILAELFLGKPVNTSRDVAELISHHRATETAIDPLSSVDVDPAVERAVLACLQKRPEDRPRSARQLANLLPGGDPLEAAVAAGTTPSPELVVNAPSKDRLSLLLAVGMLLVIAIGLIVNVQYLRRSTRMFEASPHILSARCETILEMLGYDDLPKNTRSGIAQNFEVQKQMTRLKSAEAKAFLERNSQPLYEFWRRWTDGVFMVENFHAAFASTANGPIIRNSSEATVIVDETGKLLGLKVIGLSSDGDANTARTVDWSNVLALSGIESGEAQEVDPVTAPSIYCSERKTWRVNRNDKTWVIQAGALYGKCNYLEVIGLQEAMELPHAKSDVTYYLFIVAINFFVSVIAWLNVRASRADWHGAWRAAVFMLGLYFFQEAASIHLNSPDLFESLIGLFLERAWGHTLGHAFYVWVAYVAIEPYVRRYWPRSLVGFSRALDCRWGDETVGRELLIGVAVSYLMCTVYASVQWMTDVHFSLVRLALIATSPAQWLAGMVNAVSSGLLIVLSLAALCVVVRIIAKQKRFQMAIIIVIITLSGLLATQVGEEAPRAMPFYLAAMMLIITTLISRIGLLAAYIALLSSSLLANSLPMKADSWYVGYSFALLAFPAALGVYGFVTSQGGIVALLRFLEPSPEGAS